MFGKRISMDEMEAGKLASLKHYLSRELSTSIKKLQRDHISSDSAIRSGETANKICNVIEAVFLHNLKESYSTKTPWSFLVKFTHKDVVAQLKSLTQVNTEIGYCRAWVRLALNDGLMDSYMDAMLCDMKAIQSHYKRTSFLRDTEEPYIMKNYLQGLVNFTFQLSFNSSLLKVWGAAPMILSGSWNEPRERTRSNPSHNQQIVTGGPPLGIHQADRRTQDILKDKVRSEDSRPTRAWSFEESFHECEISSTLLRSPSEDGSTLQIMGQPAEPTLVDGTTDRNGGVSEDLPEIRQDSFEDSIVIHMVSSGSEEHCASSAATSDKVETVYQSKNVAKAEIFSTEKENDFAEKPSTISRPKENLPPRPLEQTDTTNSRIQVPVRDSSTVDKNLELSTQHTKNTRKEPQEGAVQQSKLQLSLPPQIEENTIEDNEPEEVIQRVHGNSLGAMSGWSSEFQNQLSPETPSKGELSAADNVSRISYDTMLQHYTLQGPKPPTSFPDALNQASNDFKVDPMVKQMSIFHANKPNDLDDVPSDFEVIPLSTSPTSQYADARTQSLLAMLTEIGREKGLDRQNYQCKGCSRPVGIIYGKARVCNYDGNYYCYDCHKDDDAIIPARILYNWDFHKHKVAVHTKLFLQQIEEMPLIDVKECNPTLYKAVPELNNVLRVRIQLKYLKAYLFTCKQSVAEELRKRIWPREYMLDHAHLYAVQDFNQVQSGVLFHFLRKAIVFAAKHVQQCALCSQKGFICLICDNPKIIYPFDTDLTVRCETCKTVFHKACKSDTKPCPKCERRLLRRQQLQPSPQSLDFASPFT